MNSDDSDTDFITRAQYIALQQHFHKFLESIKENDQLIKIQVEISKLLDAFKICYKGSEQKTRKIRELTALHAIEVQEERSIHSLEEEAVQGLKNTISVLQQDLDAVKEQRRELLEEIDKLKKPVDTQDKIIQVESKICEHLQVDKDKKIRRPKNDVIRSSSFKNYSLAKQKFRGKLKDKEVTDSKVLKKDLDILVADLKSARLKIEELKRTIQEKDVLVEEYSKDLAESEIKFIEEQKKTSKIIQPMEIALERSIDELKNKKQKFKETYENFKKVTGDNTKLEKENISKESIIEFLTYKVKELELEKISAVRKADLFEDHLAESHNYIKELKHEIEILEEEIATLIKDTKLQTVNHGAPPPRIEKEKYIEQSIHDKLIDNFKHQVRIREKKLQAVGEELKATVDILQSVKMDFRRIDNEKYSLESEIRDLKITVKEKNGEIKQLKDKLNDKTKEIATLRKELHNRIRKQQQLMDKKNKLHSLYTHMKQMNSDQKNENMMLCKRQDYLVKILKEKDAEIEKVVKWKRYIG